MNTCDISSSTWSDACKQQAINVLPPNLQNSCAEDYLFSTYKPIDVFGPNIGNVIQAVAAHNCNGGGGGLSTTVIIIIIVIVLALIAAGAWYAKKKKLF